MAVRNEGVSLARSVFRGSDSSYSLYAYTVAIAATKTIVASRVFMVVLEESRTEIHVRTLARFLISLVIG